MGEQTKKDILKQCREDLLPEVLFWNRNRLFLTWAFCAAVVLTTAIELIKIISPKGYPGGIGFMFLFGLILVIIIGRKLDQRANDVNKTYNLLDKLIKEEK